MDWSGLFNWTMKHNDGTAPSEFSTTSDSDKQFIENAMKEYTYNDTDAIKRICGLIVNHDAMS